jgi:hypothetical protein
VKVRQPYDEPRHVPWLGRVIEPDEVVSIPDDQLAHYMEARWEPADDRTMAAAMELIRQGLVSLPTDEGVREQPSAAPAAEEGEH